MSSRVLRLSLLLSIWLLLGVVVAQAGTYGSYKPGDFQTTNPNYPVPNPFYFEGRIDWNLLGITQPSNTWEYLQRGIHYQDDLDDTKSAIADYQTALSLNSLQNGTCQIVTAASLVQTGTTAGTLPSTLSPAPCIFTIRLRLGYLLRQSNPAQAISMFQEVLQIDPIKLGVNSLIGATYVIQAEQTVDKTAQQVAYNNAIQAFQAELALSPVTPQTIALTNDLANNAHVHWALSEIYQALGQNSNAITELQSYLQATQWHSDVYPWRITLANTMITSLQGKTRSK